MSNSIVVLVNERLNLVQMIMQHRETLMGFDLAKELPNGRWTHPWFQFDCLCNYLLLTCFDLLGQPSDYLDFHSWLSSSKSKPERLGIVEEIKAEDFVGKVMELHKGYLLLYGTKNSFMRFINEILSAQQKEILLNSIRITYGLPLSERKENTSHPSLGSEESPAKKSAFLFSARNLYTHKAQNIGGFGDAIFPKELLEETVKHRAQYQYELYRPIYSEETAKYCISYSACNWPDVLINCINSVLGQYQMNKDE